jgi:hypothetical protein
MKPSASFVAVSVAIMLALLNYLWLAGGNASWIPETGRSMVKTVSLGLAIAVFISGAFVVARGAPEHGVRVTAATGALSGGLGFLLVLLSSAVLARGQFFHDGVRPGPLAVALLSTIAGGAVVGGTVGWIVRFVLAGRST